MAITLEQAMGQAPFTPAKRDSVVPSATKPKAIRIPEGSLLPADPKVREVITAAAERHKINPAYLFALAHQESRYNPDAEGPEVPLWDGTTGKAKGMFQFTDPTAKGHGIDAYNYTQSADAAAKDLADQMAKEGIPWAIAHHHAGPNPKLHGPKTQAYAAEVLDKARAIAQELGIEFTEVAPEVTSSNAPAAAPKAKKKFTLDEAMGVATPATPKQPTGAKPEEESFLDTLGRRVRQEAAAGGSASPNVVMDTLGAGIKRSIARGWEGIQDALNRETVEVTYTPEEAKRYIQGLPWYDRPSVDVDNLTEEQRTFRVAKKTVEQEEQEWMARLKANPQDAYLLPKRLEHLRAPTDTSRFAAPNTFKGAMQRIVAGHKNPMDLLLQDSIPANAVTYLLNLPEAERQNFDRVRSVTRALEIRQSAAAPEDAKQWANDTLASWEAQTDPSIKRAWKALYEAAKTNPGQIGQAFSEALFADPYMVAAPAGVGLKVVRTAQKVATGAKATSIAGRVAKVADAILDGSVTSGTITVTAGAMHNLATTGTVNQDEVRLNAAMGVLFGGTLAPLFMKAAKAKSRLHETDKLKAEGAYEEALADAAKADVELENQVRGAYDPEYGIGPQTTKAQQFIAGMTGIPMDEMVRPKGGRKGELIEKWLAERREEIKKSFTDQAAYADYLEYVAQERLDRAAELAAAAEAKAAAQQAAADKASTRAANYREEWQGQFDRAVEQRNALKDTQEDIAWQKHEEAAEIADRLNAEELMDALYTQDDPTIKQTQAKIDRREAGLNRPKWQRGSADPETLARLGIAGAGAAAAYAAFPEDQKLSGALLGGLAGLVVPAGGSVLRRMKQSGAIASDGQIIAALTKAGKLASKLDEAEIKARDTAWIEQARAGDQRGFGQLYDTYFNKIKRFANKFTSNRESWMGVDAEDIAQQAFFKAFKKIQDEPETVIDNFPALVTTIAENEAKNALTARTADMRGGKDTKVLNEDMPGGRDQYEGDPTSGFSLLDRYSETPGYDVGVSGAMDTPEALAVRDQTLDIVRQALDGLAEQTQDIFTKVHLEHYTLEEAAAELGISKSGAWHQLRRAENRVAENIQQNKLKFGEPAVRGPRSQRGEASPEFTRKLATITAVATGAGTAGYFLYDGDPWKTAVTAGFGGALATGLAGGGTKNLSKALRGIDYRLKEFGPTLYGAAKRHGYQELKGIREYNNATADFITQFNNLPDNVKPVLVRALSTRDKTVINKMLNHLGGEKFVKAFDKVRTKLDEIEDQLVGYGLIKKSEKDYFPFRVKDLDGLRKELGAEASSAIDAAIAAAEKKMQEKAGRPLNEIERGIVINKVLEPYLGKPTAGHMPGFAKARTIQEIPENLQKYYHDPVETLNSYGVQSVKYIERAKFFGKHLVKKKEGNQEFVDISKSIGELVDDLKKKNEINDQQAFELANMLQDRFEGGEKGTNRVLAGMKNLVNGSLLGHIASAAVQLGDVALQAMVHGPRASVKALKRQITRNKLRKLDDFGLNEHIAHEFLSDGWTRKVSDWSFKWGGFRTIDAVGKNFGINAAIERMMRDAQTPQGQMRLAERYQRFFPEEYPKALAALKKGEINEAVELFAFTDLTKTQPLTQWELPQFYQKFPNGRVLYHLQTFSLRVLNMVYEDALKGITSGNLKQATKGARNLLGISAVLGVQGVATDKIKDFLAGKPVELSFEEIPINALEALGLSLYDYNRIADKGPLQGFAESKMPPALRMSSDLLNEPERSLRYIPVVGRAAYDYFREPLEARRKERRKRQGYKMEITVPSKKKPEVKT